MTDEFDHPQYDFDPNNLPQELLAAIGLSITCAAHTQSALDDAIGGCLGIDYEYCQALTAHMPMPLKKSVLLSAAELKIRDVETLVRLEDYVNAISDAMDARNYVAHDTFCVQLDTKEVVRFNRQARAGLKMLKHPVSVDHIKREALAILEIGKRFYSFLMSIDLLAGDITDTDLPLPLSPTMAIDSPSPRSNHTPLTAWMTAPSM